MTIRSMIKGKVTRLTGKPSRSELRVFNTLGVVSMENDSKTPLYRTDDAELYDRYIKGKQYDHLRDWEEGKDESGNYVPVRQRKPRIQTRFAEAMCNKVASKLVGHQVFPRFSVEDDPITEDFFRAVLQATKLKAHILMPVRAMLGQGSSFLRFYVSQGRVRWKFYNTKYCYPSFLPNNELANVRIQYVFDSDETDPNGAPVKKWYRLDVGMMEDTLYNNPKYHPEEEPVFSVVNVAEHNLGYVQGEWFKSGDSGDMTDSPDGPSLIDGILPFIEELDYSFSQSSTSVSYNQDPILTLKGMDEEEVSAMIRTSSKALNLGKDGEAGFAESSMSGVDAASNLRDKVRLQIQDIARVVLLDPEKIVGHAQSAKAMEVLHGPLVDLVHEIRPFIEEPMVKLMQKVGITLLVLQRQGAPIPMIIPPGFIPTSLNLVPNWPPIFPLTTEDLKNRVAWVSSATSANLVSRETGTRILAKDFGIEDVEEELAKINSQPVLNPFGMF